MNWFEKTLGFTEVSPQQVRSRLSLEGMRIRSDVNGAVLGCGWLENPRLSELRERSRSHPDLGPSTVTEVVGDAGALHRDPRQAGALFQVASQFNLLEMISPRVTPEEGVGIYSQDATQGPACAIACGGGTIYRNYFVPIDGQVGQTATRQVDCLADLQEMLGQGHWTMQNGYALASEKGLKKIAAMLDGADDATRDAIRGLLRIGIQHDVAVIGTNHTVTQVYGSALPVAYGAPARALWEPFARLVLEASYEATLLTAQIWQTGPVFLTFLGGGVFGNASQWIEDAMVRAISRVPGLDIGIVSYRTPRPEAARVIARCKSGARPPDSRTSRSHPLRVDWIQPPSGPPIGVTFAPGKVQAHARSGSWRRSLEVDLDRLVRVHQVDRLVCLVEDHELVSLQIPALETRCRAHGIMLHRLPIVDGDVPTHVAMHSLLDGVLGRRSRGQRVVFHCKGGLGRAGTAAACALVKLGVPAPDAISTVRTARPGAIETAVQEAFILAF